MGPDPDPGTRSNPMAATGLQSPASRRAGSVRGCATVMAAFGGVGAAVYAIWAWRMGSAAAECPPQSMCEGPWLFGFLATTLAAGGAALAGIGLLVRWGAERWCRTQRG